MLNVVSVAAATAVVGYDLLRDAVVRASSRPRRLRKIGLCGSAAAGDTEVEVLVGNMSVARVFNTNTGFPQADASMFAVEVLVPANEEVHAIVRDAPATNPINLATDIT